MGIKLDYDFNTVLATWKVTYKQTSAYEGDFDDLQVIYVIAPDKGAAYYWAEDATTSHGNICEVLDIAPVVSDPVQLAYESYTPEGEEYYVLFGVKSGQHQFKGPFEYEHQAQKYAKGVDKSHNPRVVVHYKENDDE